jgi:hypothetical protein
VTFALVRATLHLPHSILYPAFDAWTELAAEAGKVNEKLEERDVDEHSGERQGKDEDEAEEVDVAGDKC